MLIIEVNIMNQLILVSVLAIIDNQNKVLITKRPTDKPFGNFWEFPGGKLKKRNPRARNCKRDKRRIRYKH